MLLAKKPSTTADDDDEEDITPGDWSADDDDDDIVLDDDFEDDDEDEDDDDDTDEAVIVAEDDDDDDDDELDIDEIDLDDDDDDEEEEEDDIIQEETVGKAKQQDEEEAEDWMEDDGYYAVDWDEDQDGGEYELEDDPDDPDYTRQKELVEQAVAASEKRAAEEAFDRVDFIQNQMSEEMKQKLEELPFMKQVEEQTRDMLLTEEDVSGMDLEKEVQEVSALEEDPYPHVPEGLSAKDVVQPAAGLTEADMEEFDQTYKDMQEVIRKEPWDKVMLKGLAGFDGLSNETLAEIEDCLGEVGGGAYNITNWVLYDLDFNVSNLILASVKHNRNAPILFQHWYPQLVTYERYQHARDRNFDFTWDDVEKADITELERYYAGFGYNEIPHKAPAETGIISLEYLDEEEIKMAAFENWVKEVYNPEEDRKDFDDDTMRDEDNVFSEFYEPPQHPDLPTFEDTEEDLAQWHKDIGDDPDMRSYRDMMGRNFEFDVVQDEEFQREFRGHLIIACTGEDSDLEIAEKITLRFEKEFGKKVFVETRVMALAQEEDNVFEIWLESYEIDLLHSKKRASLNVEGWEGPAEVDDAQIDHLTERVRFLISDDARYSYRMVLEDAQ